MFNECEFKKMFFNVFKSMKISVFCVIINDDDKSVVLTGLDSNWSRDGLECSKTISSASRSRLW